MTKTQLLDALSESTGLNKKDVASVLDQAGVVIERHVKRRAGGTFTLPGLLKIKVVRKPATKARKMISPFTGQEITVAAKPASRAVKVQPLSGLKARGGVGSGSAGRSTVASFGQKSRRIGGAIGPQEMPGLRRGRWQAASRQAVRGAVLTMC